MILELVGGPEEKSLVHRAAAEQDGKGLTGLRKHKVGEGCILMELAAFSVPGSQLARLHLSGRTQRLRCLLWKAFSDCTLVLQVGWALWMLCNLNVSDSAFPSFVFAVCAGHGSGQSWVRLVRVGWQTACMPYLQSGLRRATRLPG